MRLKDMLSWAVEELRKYNSETPRLDAEVLLAYTMKMDRLQVYLNLGDVADEERESSYRILIEKRSACMPVSYLTGHKEFMSLDFIVNENVLIPRSETEILVETVCELGIPQGAGGIRGGCRVLELGTGSGAIAVSLARYNPDWRVLATDLSEEALLVARENARFHGVMDRITFLQSDLFSALSRHSKFDWVVSNPPYISARDLTCLPAGIREYEPMLALDGGADGLDVIKRIIAETYIVLRPGGRLAIEIGYGQSEEVQKITDEIGKYSDYSIIKDYSGIPRIFCCRSTECRASTGVDEDYSK